LGGLVQFEGSNGGNFVKKGQQKNHFDG